MRPVPINDALWTLSWAGSAGAGIYLSSCDLLVQELFRAKRDLDLV